MQQQGAQKRHAHDIVPVRIDDRTTIDVLLLDQPDGTVRECTEIQDLCRALAKNAQKRKSMRALVATVGRLHDFHALVYKFRPLDEHSIVDFIQDYGLARLHGTRSESGDDLGKLGWHPVRWGTFKTELRWIALLLRYWIRHYGIWPLFVDAAQFRDRDGFVRYLRYLHRETKKGFFGHLADRRRHWETLAGSGRPLFYGRSKAPAKRNYKRLSLNERFIRDLIESERNPVFRAFWTLGGFGGARGSEQLHMLECDVLPASYRRLFFPGDRDTKTPLVVLAHPEESTWCGSISERCTRRQFLEDRYRLSPRTTADKKPAEAGGLGQVGWKGILLTNTDRQISQIYWLDPAMAFVYAAAVEEICRIRDTYGIGRRHPFLLINTDLRKPWPIFGRPLQLSNIRKAWERACRRLGVQPWADGRHPHGLRHFYKTQLEAMGIDAEYRKTMMHHHTIDAQEEYGMVANARVRDELQVGYAKRSAPKPDTNPWSS